MGIVIHWSNAKGFGILRSQTHGEVFMHVKSLTNTTELSVGDVVTYEMNTISNHKNRPEAVRVHKPGASGAPSNALTDGVGGLGITAGIDLAGPGIEWVCKCGFRNRATNGICGGKGTMGCKTPYRNTVKKDTNTEPLPIVEPIGGADGGQLSAIAEADFFRGSGKMPIQDVNPGLPVDDAALATAAAEAAKKLLKDMGAKPPAAKPAVPSSSGTAAASGSGSGRSKRRSPSARDRRRQRSRSRSRGRRASKFDEEDIETFEPSNKSSELSAKAKTAKEQAAGWTRSPGGLSCLYVNGVPYWN